jgi:glycosyltransferase involved in cell wall biosynthesis
LAIALNLGLEVCEGEFIARLDTDDYCDPNRLEVQSDFLLKNKEIHILGSFANIVDENNKNSGIRKSPIYNNEIYEQLWCNPIIHPSVIFRKVDIMKIGGYDVNLRRRQDYELWFRAAKNKLKFHNIDTPLIYYRVDTDSHKKQNITLAFQQGLIGFKGTIRADLGLKNACICFYPFFRQLLPIKLQHHLYELLSIFDPRAK